MANKSLKLLGALVAGTGAAHFVVPETFEQLTKSAFPDDTKQWVQRNGATEVAIGLAIVGGRTRKFGVVALLGYTGWLVSRVAASS
ncbi:MAG: hypothetical protein M3N95_14210 [Actinomycetota bacterium]|nr:hypothetical protein [Actinomycetota bacterium]